MGVLYHAFKSGTITDNPLTNVATSVNSAGFSALPTVANPDTAWLVFDPEGTAGTPEIAQLTVHTAAATVGTVVRGQQTAFGGSAARQHAVGTKWVLALTPSDLLFLLNQVLTTKGDIAAYSTTPTRLAVGADGHFLKANSSQATGLEWASADPVRHAVQVFSSVATPLTSGVFTGVAFNSESYDTDGYHDNVTNNGRLTVPAGLGGLYVVSACLLIAQSGGVFSAFDGGIVTNGVFMQHPLLLNRISGLGADIASGSTVVLLNAGDYVEVGVRVVHSATISVAVQSADADQIQSPFMQMAQVSA